MIHIYNFHIRFKVTTQIINQFASRTNISYLKLGNIFVEGSAELTLSLTPG